MDKVISAPEQPILAVFRNKNGTPIYIDSSIASAYVLRDDGTIVDLRTGTAIGQGFKNDLKFPSTLVRRGSLSKPDFDYTNMGLLFPQNDTTEIAYMVSQLPHSVANTPLTLGSATDLEPHIHFMQTSASVPVFKMDFKWYNNGEAIPAAYTTIATTSLVWTYVSGNLAQIARFPAITNTGQRVSSIIEIKLYRDDNVVTGDVLVKEFDLHYWSYCAGTEI